MTAPPQQRNPGSTKAVQACCAVHRHHRRRPVNAYDSPSDSLCASGSTGQRPWACRSRTRSCKEKIALFSNLLTAALSGAPKRQALELTQARSPSHAPLLSARKNMTPFTPGVPRRIVSAHPVRSDGDPGHIDHKLGCADRRFIYRLFHTKAPRRALGDRRLSKLEYYSLCISEFENYMPRVAVASNWMRRDRTMPRAAGALIQPIMMT